MGRQFSIAKRKELAEAAGECYRHSTRSERKTILDEFVRLTGYHRTHAIRVLTTSAKPWRNYASALEFTMRRCESRWLCCGKRLIEFAANV